MGYVTGSVCAAGTTDDNVVRLFPGLFLLAAAVLKGHPWVMEPACGAGLFAASRFSSGSSSSHPFAGMLR